MLRDASVGPTSRVLDVGCGTGSLVRFLAETYGCECTGIDFAGEAIAYLRTEFPKNGVAYQEVDIDDLSPVNQQYDVVLMIDAFFLATDPRQVIRELIARLSRGGRLIITHSQYPMTEHDIGLIQSGFTTIDPILAELEVSFRSYDCTEYERRYWRTAVDQLNSRKDAFIGEGSAQLWEGRLAEAAGAEEMIAMGHIRKIYVVVPTQVPLNVASTRNTAPSQGSA